jgi:hypothetical protein
MQKFETLHNLATQRSKESIVDYFKRNAIFASVIDKIKWKDVGHSQVVGTLTIRKMGTMEICFARKDDQAGVTTVATKHYPKFWKGFAPFMLLVLVIPSLQPLFLFIPAMYVIQKYTIKKILRRAARDLQKL